MKKKPFGRLLENHLGCDCVQKLSLPAGSGLNRTCSHVSWFGASCLGTEDGQAVTTHKYLFFFFRHLLGWIFFSQLNVCKRQWEGM